jgi:hypothetical protein
VLLYVFCYIENTFCHILTPPVAEIFPLSVFRAET